jgi:hypothetical protein
VARDGHEVSDGIQTPLTAWYEGAMFHLTIVLLALTVVAVMVVTPMAVRWLAKRIDGDHS